MSKMAEKKCIMSYINIYSCLLKIKVIEKLSQVFYFTTTINILQYIGEHFNSYI